jgi:glycosyltransferase involved in cell wall biosynthesis
LLVRCGDVAGLAGALGRLADDSELRRRLGERGRERTLQEFRWEDKLSLVRSTLGGLCEGGGRSFSCSGKWS